MLKLSNGRTDWHQIWHKSADSSGNGHRLNTIRPPITQGVLGGSQIQKYWEAVVHVCGFVWEWTKFKFSSPPPPNIPGGISGVLGCHKFKSMLKLSNGWTDWHQIWYTCADSPGNGYSPNKLSFETQGALGGFRGSNIQKS